jgi:DNA-binding CsgD family transcriptional regulator
MLATNFFDPAPAHNPLVHALAALQGSIDLEGFWQSTLGLIRSALPTHSCSLLLGITDYQPRSGRHHVEQPVEPGYLPATSLTVSGPFLAAHPHVKLYTYSQIVSLDPQAHQRRLAQEAGKEEWSDFVHLAFWEGLHPEAVLSIRRSPVQARFDTEELTFLERIWPVIDAGLRRLRTLDFERMKLRAYERLLQHSPVAAMLLDANGSPVFASPEGIAMCERWNHGLRGRGGRAAGFFRLPEDINEMLDGDGSVQSDDRELFIQHPYDGALQVAVTVSRHAMGLGRQPCYVLRFLAADGRRLSERATAVLQKLSPSERQVALLLAEGMRNDDIARRLSRSRRTIECQLNAIYGKLDVSCRTQLVLALV